jgi:hypothetical protein
MAPHLRQSPVPNLRRRIVPMHRTTVPRHHRLASRRRPMVRRLRRTMVRRPCSRTQPLGRTMGAPLRRPTGPCCPDRPLWRISIVGVRSGHACLWGLLGAHCPCPILGDGTAGSLLRATYAGTCGPCGAVALLLLAPPPGEAHVGQLLVVACTGSPAPSESLLGEVRRWLAAMPATISSGASHMGGPRSGHPFCHPVVAHAERLVAGSLRLYVARGVDRASH